MLLGVVEVRHSVDVPLPVRESLGETEGEKVTEEVRQSEEVGLPLKDAEGLPHAQRGRPPRSGRALACRWLYVKRWLSQTARR